MKDDRLHFSTHHLFTIHKALQAHDCRCKIHERCRHCWLPSLKYPLIDETQRQISASQPSYSIASNSARKTIKAETQAKPLMLMAYVLLRVLHTPPHASWLLGTPYPRSVMILQANQRLLLLSATNRNSTCRPMLATSPMSTIGIE